MPKPTADFGHHFFDGKTTGALVSMLNQTLSETLDLAYQTKQAYWNVKGTNFYGLHLLFDRFYLELAGHVDELAERAVALGGKAHGTIRVAAATSRFLEYPLDASASKEHVEALIDRYGGYTTWIRQAIREATLLGDQDTADLYTAISRAMDKAYWMLVAHREG